MIHTVPNRKKLVAQPVRNKAYGLHPQFLVDGNLGQKSFYLKENPATMVLASPTQVSTAASGQTVSRSIQSQIMKPATLKTNQPLQTKNILLNKSASPTSNNVPPTQVRNAEGTAREGTTLMQSALSTATGTTQTRQIIQSSNQPTQNNQPTHLVYDAHRPQQIIRSNIIQNKHPITIHQTMPQSAGQQVIYYAGNPHSGAQLFQFASGPTPRIIQQVMTTNPSSDNNNYQQKFPFCVVPHPQTPTQASHVTSSHGTPIATVATTTATVSQHHQQQQFNEISQRVPILNRKRPTQTQNGVILTHQRSPPTLTTQPTIPTSNENRESQTGQPPAKQPKLEDSSNSVHIKVAQGGNIKYESSNELANQNTNRPIIRSPSRGSRRKQILDPSLVFSPVTTGSPSQQTQPQTPPTQQTKPTSTPTPDKLIDEASTDEAEECEDEPPKMKMQLENPNYPLPPYRKVSKINQARNGTSDRADQIKPPRAIRTPKPRPLPSTSSTTSSSATSSSKSSTMSHNNESSGKQNTRIYMNGYDFKAERSSTLHFMCSDDVKHDSGHVFDPKLNLKQLKDHSRCCFYKLNLLNKELSSCQANQRHLQDQFQRRKHKECIH